MATLKMKSTKVFEENRNAKTRIVLNVGSSRSSKTYSLMQYFITLLFSTQNLTIDVVRKTLPSLKASAYKDFLEILQDNDLYNPNRHNRSELTYKVGSSEICFFSVDDYKKVKGRKRDILLCNEANELTYQEFNQLALRTTKQIFLDLNPSHIEDHWIETKIKIRDDVTLIHSTYKDNPFLPGEIVREIEGMEHRDPNLWRIYGLGEMGIAEARIYSHFQLIDKLPEVYPNRFYVIDFGFNHKTAVLEIIEKDEVFYVKELLYESGLTNNDLIARLNDMEISKTDIIYGDSEAPDRIQEILEAGYNIHPAKKGPGSVKKGIDTVKSKEVHITKDSVNLLKESRSYSWKVTADGIILDEPVKFNDHAMDALRYGIYSESKKPFIGII